MFFRMNHLAIKCALIVVLLLAVAEVQVEAGCPRDDDACENYCESMGYEDGDCRGYSCICSGLDDDKRK